MIPLPDYVTLKETDTIYDIFQLLEKNKVECRQAHRDVIVVDNNGKLFRSNYLICGP